MNISTGKLFKNQCLKENTAQYGSIEPDWTIEILSPNQSQTKVTKNILHCLVNDSKLGWLIDPQEQSVLVYFPNQQPAFFEVVADILPVPDFARAVQINVGRIIWLAIRVRERQLAKPEPFGG